MLRGRTFQLSALALATALAAPALPARADLMTTCAPEIAQFCSDVSKGRGRISACLAGRMDRLNAACRTDVQGVGRSFLTPGYVRPIFESGFRAPLPQACAAPAKSFCPGVPIGDGRIFACLYARSDRVPAACSTAAQATLKQGR